MNNDFDSEDTIDIPLLGVRLPVSDSARYLSQYDAAAADDCTLSKWEHRSPGALAALQLWAAANNFSVTVRDCRSNASCIAYEVEILPAHHTITVYVTEPGGPW